MQIAGHQTEKPHVHAPQDETWAGEDFSI